MISFPVLLEVSLCFGSNQACFKINKNRLGSLGSQGVSTDPANLSFITALSDWLL
jgi:hypothetical protein